MHGTERGASRAIDLAQRAPMRAGPITITPSTREFRGPGGVITLRPQPMLVFLVLADAGGAVVSRDELVLHAWSGRFVAEDSLNGAISEVRRALRVVGAEAVEIVTVPKTGYRLVLPGTAEGGESSTEPAGMGRRWVIGAGAAALAGGAGLWLWQGTHSTRQVDGLIERGLIALRQGLPDYDAQGVAEFRRAVALDPGNARALGLLALSLKSAADYAPPDRVAHTRAEAEAAARRALVIDPRQSDALTALALLPPFFGRWLEAERRLRAILSQDADNSFAVSGLGTLLMSTGQVRRCLEQLDWLEARDPLSPNLQFRRVYTLWSAGRIAEADATADRALQSWPRHPAVWFARLWTFAFTGRAPRAQAMLADGARRPAMPPPAAQLLALSLAALAQPNSPSAQQAVRANLAAAASGPSPAISAIMVLSSLGAAAQALEVARGFLLQQGDVVVRQSHSAQQPSVTDQHHRMTMMLWIPATAALRGEPGFRALCDDMGLGDYWRAKGILPDSMNQTPPNGANAAV